METSELSFVRTSDKFRHYPSCAARSTFGRLRPFARRPGEPKNEMSDTNQYPDVTEVEVSDYVHELIQHLVDNYSEEAPNVQCEYHVQTMKLDLDTLIPAGLILCELVSNSLKHAFSESEQGRIIVKFQRSTEALLIVSVYDNGNGIPDESALKQTDGLGWKLVQTLVNNQLHGFLHWDGSNGLTVTMRFPVQIIRYASKNQ